MARDKAKWTAEELVAELRARERTRVARSAKAARSLGEGGARSRRKATATGVVARFRRLDEIPSAELAKRAADLQRAVYGADDRNALRRRSRHVWARESFKLQQTRDGP